ncbi:MAG: hypothetical protein QNJ30_20780 [Kiloniellales bacterium]|nr:hypothetical protein [Kiloniellales bacterium]
MTTADAQTRTVDGGAGARPGPALSPEQVALRAELAGSNINATTFLATDYLNHLNEAVMMIELVPSAPDILEEALAWRPKTYQEHFLSSDLALAELACRAYEIAPERFRLPFDLTVKAIQRRIATTLTKLQPLVEAGDHGQIGLVVLSSCKAIQDLIGVAAAIVNGSERMADCATSPGPAPAQDDETTMSQAQIDALFG